VDQAAYRRGAFCLSAYIAGWFAVFFGLLWTFFPATLRWWLVGKASWALYWLLLAYLYVPLSSFFHQYGWRGWLGLAIALIVIGTLLRKAVARLSSNAPLVVFRVIGAINLAAGIYLIFFKHRI
jgi:hypothetical protein